MIVELTITSEELDVLIRHHDQTLVELVDYLDDDELAQETYLHAKHRKAELREIRDEHRRKGE